MTAIIVIAALLIIFISLLSFLEGELKLLSLLMLPITLLACAIMDINITEYRLYTVDYKAVETPFKIIVVTDYGIFESEKMVDFENWSKNSQGYVIKAYDYFGHEDYKEFTTTPYSKGLNFSNEHR